MSKRSKRGCCSVLILSIALTFAISLNSCGAPTLEVESVDYQGLTRLTAAEPDEEAIKKWPFFDYNPYILHSCGLSLTSDGRLVISDLAPQSKDSHVMKMDCNFFVGTALGEFGGWVKMFKYNEDLLPEEKQKAVDIVDENCAGFIKLDNQNGYFITSRSNFNKAVETKGYGESVIYKLAYSAADGEWQWEELGQADGYPDAFVYDEESDVIYIASCSALSAFSPDSRESRILADLTLWYYSGASSIVQLDNKLYIGMSMGIYEYDLSSGESLWYPMEFEKYGVETYSSSNS